MVTLPPFPSHLNKSSPTFLYSLSSQSLIPSNFGPPRSFDVNGKYSKSHLLVQTPLHGTILRTRMICKRLLCYVYKSACRCRIADRIKIFCEIILHFTQAMQNIFQIFENYCNFKSPIQTEN